LEPPPLAKYIRLRNSHWSTAVFASARELKYYGIAITQGFERSQDSTIALE
jgi:hypothetical protein